MTDRIRKVSVILPTYKEKDNIVELITAVMHELSKIDAEKEIVVVDDNSPDNTAGIVKERFGNDPDVKVLVRTKEKGLATAIRYGIEKSSGDAIVVMDTDFNHDPKMLPQMIKFLEFYDLVGGSRFTMGGGMYSRTRYAGSFAYNMLIRILLRTQIQDNLSGFFAARRGKLLALGFKQIFYGYGDYYFRLLCYARKNNFKILEVPVIYPKRKNGESKTNLVPISILYTKNLTRFLLQKK